MSKLGREFAIALNHVIVVCREAATHHLTASEICSNAAIQGGLKKLSSDRSAAFEDMAHELEVGEDDPKSPTHEKELLDSVMTHFKAAISRDEIAQLLNDCESKERRIVEAVGAALGHAHDLPIKFRLKNLQNDARNRIGMLRQELDIT